jgi:hypothetical protein
MGMGMVTQTSPNDAERMAIVVQQVDALQLALTGQREEALALLRKAAASERAMPFEFGPPFIQKPTHELLAEQLSALKKTAEASEAYRVVLARAPGRTTSVEGLKSLTAH